MNRQFRKIHRILAPLMALPLILTILTGMLVTMNQDWPFNLGLRSSVLLKIHTGEILGLEAIYPILNGLGLLVLLVTGLSMTGLFRQKRRPEIAKNKE